MPSDNRRHDTSWVKGHQSLTLSLRLARQLLSFRDATQSPGKSAIFGSLTAIYGGSALYMVVMQRVGRLPGKSIISLLGKNCELRQSLIYWWTLSVWVKARMDNTWPSLSDIGFGLLQRELSLSMWHRGNGGDFFWRKKRVHDPCFPQAHSPSPLQQKKKQSINDLIMSVLDIRWRTCPALVKEPRVKIRFKNEMQN